MTRSEDDYLLLSGLQHFSFCRRQWALIHIEQQWSENLLTAEGRVVHQRVHDRTVKDVRDGVITVRDMAIKSHELGLTGRCDAVEFLPAEEGIQLHKKKGLWQARPVEYKRGKPKNDDCDRLQLTAQAMCLEEMLCCEIPVGCLYYHEINRREEVELTKELRDKVRTMAEEMHQLYKRGYTPKVKPQKGCAKCSMAEACLPKLTLGSRPQPVREYVEKMIGEEET